MIIETDSHVVSDAALVACRPAGLGEEAGGPPVGSWEWSIRTDQCVFSPRALELLGLPPDRPHGTRDGLLRSLRYEDALAVTAALKEAVERQQSIELLLPFSNAEGQKWIELRADLLPDARGPRYVGTLADVTARVRERDAIGWRERQLRDLIQVIPAAIYLTDAQGRITLYNQAAADLWGHRPTLGTDQWCGSWRLFWPDGRPMPHDECPMAVALKEDRLTHGGEAIAERPDGTRVPFVAFPTPLHDASGALVGAVNMLVDASDRKRMEGSLSAQIREVEALNARLQRAMAETHHRVKNNLQVVSAIVDMRTSQAEGMVPVDDIRSLSLHIRALAMIHEMLTRAAKSGDEAETISSHDMLAAMVPLLELSAAGHQLHFQLQDVELPIRTATSLALVANELIQNAVKYGRREVFVDFSAEGNRGHLRVRDDGPGFPPDFDPALLETTGIELVRNLSRWDLGGSADFRNLPTGGAEVDVELPIPTPA